MAKWGDFLVIANRDSDVVDSVNPLGVRYDVQGASLRTTEE